MVDNLRQQLYRYIPLVVSVPAGTTAANPQTTSAGLPDCILDSVEVQIPPGHAGLTGFALTYAGQQVFPWSNVAAWLTADDYVNTFDIGMEVGSQLRVVAYNTDTYAHSFYVRMKVHDLPVASEGTLQSTEPAQVPPDQVPAVTSLPPATLPAGGTGNGGGVVPVASAPSPITTPPTPVPVTVIPPPVQLPPSTPIGGTTVPPTTTTTPPPASTGAPAPVDPNDPTIVAMQTSITQLQQQLAALTQRVTAAEQAATALAARVTTLEQKAKASQPTATSTAPGASTTVVQQLATAAAAGQPSPIPPSTNSSGQLIDPTTGRVAYTGPNGEAGYGSPQYPGQPSYTLPGGIVAYYTPGTNIQNGNRSALGLPPV